MSNKYECPSCKAYSSRIFDVFDGEYDNCPNCGLSGDAMREIHKARESHASAEVIAKYEALELRAGRAEAELATKTAKLERIKRYFAGFNWDGVEGDCFGD